MLDVEDAKTFWTKSPDAICTALACTRGGLSSQEAATRLVHDGPNSDTTPRRVSVVRSIGRRLIEPLSLILIVAGAVSAGTGDTIGGSIIVVILGLSIGLDTLQERQAAKTAEALRNTVALKAEVKRDGVFKQIYVEQVVAGDVLRVRGGDIIPADALVIESTAFTAGEAALTDRRSNCRRRAYGQIDVVRRSCLDIGGG
jgi:Mg2+-importing ATPase